VTCAIAAGSNAAYCWGANTHGQLGAGAAATLETCSTSNASSSFPCSTRPIAVEGGRAWESISAGDDHVCAVTTSADLYCWGEGSSFGAPSGNTPSPVLVASGMKFSEVSAGGKHTCGLAQASSAAYCWGIGGFGEVGTGTPSANQTTPTQVLPLALHIDAGQLGTCAVLFDGRAQCWGLNESGAVGDGTTTNRSTPTTVVTALSLTSISASGDHSCGRSTTGQLWCWGNDSEGQLGIGSGSGRASAPQLVRP
jgi:alpha-tubulin suppressor-like RCC1 family protein